LTQGELRIGQKHDCGLAKQIKSAVWMKDY